MKNQTDIKPMSTPTIPPPELLHIERDGAEVYVTASDGLERLCTMSRPGEAKRLADARMIVRAVNARIEQQRALITVARGYIQSGRPDLAALVLAGEKETA